MIKQTTLLIFLFFPPFSFCMDPVQPDPVMTKAIWIEHLWRNAGAFSHDSICTLALVDKQLHKTIINTAMQRKKHLSLLWQNYPKAYQQATWHKYGSLCALIKNLSNKEATIHFVWLANNNKGRQRIHKKILYPSGVLKSNHPYFTAQDDFVYGWYIDSVNNKNKKNITEYVLTNNGPCPKIIKSFMVISEYPIGMQEKRQHSIDWNCNEKTIQPSTDASPVKLYAEKIITTMRTDFFIKDGLQHNGFYVSHNFSNDITLLDMTSGEQKAVLQGHTKLISCCIDVPQENLLISGSTDETIKIWNTYNNKLWATFNTPTICTHPNGHQDRDKIMCLAQEENHFCSASLSNPVTEWDMTTGKVVWQNYYQSKSATRSLIMRNNLLYMGASSGELTIIDLRSGYTVSANRAHKGQIPCLIPCKNSDVHFYSGSHDGVVKKWDLRNSKAITLGTHDYGVSCLYESANGRKLFSGGADGIRVWDATGTIKQPLNFLKEFNMHGKTQKLAYVDCVATNYNATEIYTSSTRGILALSLHYPS